MSSGLTIALYKVLKNIVVIASVAVPAVIINVDKVS